MRDAVHHGVSPGPSVHSSKRTAMILSGTKKRTLSNESDSSCSTVTDETLHGSRCLLRLRRPYRSRKLQLNSSLKTTLGIIPLQSKTLDDAPNLNGRIRKVGSHCFAMGGFADIWKGILDNNTLVAVKVFRNISSDEEFTDTLKIRLQREATVWLQLEHPYVMPFLGICEDFEYSNMPSLVSPYMSNHNVVKYLRRNPDSDFSASLRFLAQAGEALTYLHEQSVVHGDVKGSNIMIDDKSNAILTDFGISRMIGTSGYTTKSLAGSVRWMARELLTTEDEIPSRESDVWSFGMTILEVLTRNLPYHEIRKDTIVLLAVMGGDLPLRPSNFDAISDDTWQVLTSCWASDPKDRPSMQSLADSLWSLYDAKFDDDIDWSGEYDEDVFEDDEDD